MEATNSTDHCLNCDTPLQGGYCHQCGQKHVPREKWSVGSLIAELFENITNLDNKVFQTLKDALIRPGVVARQFCLGQRRRYASPVRILLFLFVLVFIYPFITDFTQDFSSHLQFGFFTRYAQPLIDTLQTNLGWDTKTLAQHFAERQVDVGNILVFLHVPFFALLLWLLHPQKRHFFVDHIVVSAFFLIFLLLYLYAMIFLIGFPVEFVVKQFSNEAASGIGNWLNLILLKIPFFFYLWAYLKYSYDQSWLNAALKTIPAGLGFVFAHMMYRTCTFYVTLLIIYFKNL